MQTVKTLDSFPFPIRYYVSTSLDIWACPELFSRTGKPYFPGNNRDILSSEGKIYRLFTPEYFAWLTEQFATAKRMTASGKISQATFATMQQRYKSVCAIAQQEFRQDLKVLLRNTDISAGYEKPSKFTAIRWVDWIRLAPDGVITYF